MAVSLGQAILTIGGDATGLNQALHHAEAITTSRMSNMARHASAVGVGLVAIGAAATAGLGVSIRSAISFESAFAGVRKTIDASEPEFAALNRELRELSLQIPVSAEALAVIAEMGGQLGVGKDHIIAFTRTIADLSVSTNMTAEAAATMLAQFINITQVGQDKFGNLGAAIVELGNNGASTEMQIAEMALRLAGAGTTAKITAPDILGIASALASLGIEAEAGGTAFSKVFIMIASAIDGASSSFDKLKHETGLSEARTRDAIRAVELGGEKMREYAKSINIPASTLHRLVKEYKKSTDGVAMFAQVAGLSADQFVEAWRDRPSSAIVAFVEGLDRVQKSGGSLFQVLEALDIKEVRLRDSLLRAANAGGTLGESIDRATRAFRQNTALTEEAEKRYATTESQLILLKNQIAEMSRTIGEVLLPPLRTLVQAAQVWVARLTEWLRANPELTAQILKIAVVIGGLAVALGPLLIALPGLVSLFAGVTAVVGMMISPMGAVAALVGGGLVMAFLALRDQMGNFRQWVTDNWDRIVQVFHTGVELVRNVFSIFSSVLKIALTVIGGMLAGWARGFAEAWGIVTSESAVGSGDFLDTLQAVLETMNEILPPMVEWFSKLSVSAIENFDSIMRVTRLLGHVVGGTMKAIADTFILVTGIIRSGIDGIGRAIEWLRGIFGSGDIQGPPGIPAFAGGGTMSRSGLAIVGEQGRELVQLPGGTRVMNNRNTEEILSGRAGGTTVNIGGVTVNAGGTSDARALAHQVSVEIERALQNRLAKMGMRLQSA